MYETIGYEGMPLMNGRFDLPLIDHRLDLKDPRYVLLERTKVYTARLQVVGWKSNCPRKSERFILSGLHGIPPDKGEAPSGTGRLELAFHFVRFAQGCKRPITKFHSQIGRSFFPCVGVRVGASGCED